MYGKIALASALALAAAAPVLPAQQADTSPRQPSGWVGITYSVNSTIDRDGNINFTEYPVVVSVDPGSPAAKAGIAAGDTIISFNSRDVTRYPVPLRSMLKPGSRFMFRYKRTSVPRTATIIVAERPTNMRERMEVTIRSVEVDGERGDRGSRAVLLPRSSGSMVGTPVRVPVPGVGFAFSTASTAIAGAEIAMLSRGMAEALGVKHEGVIVVNVVNASPARDAGLMGGDVVVTVDKVPVNTPLEFAQMVRAAEDRAAKLVLIRKKKTETVTLRW